MPVRQTDMQRRQRTPDSPTVMSVSVFGQGSRVDPPHTWPKGPGHVIFPEHQPQTDRQSRPDLHSQYVMQRRDTHTLRDRGTPRRTGPYNGPILGPFLCGLLAFCSNCWSFKCNRAEQQQAKKWARIFSARLCCLSAIYLPLPVCLVCLSV